MGGVSWPMSLGSWDSGSVQAGITENWPSALGDFELRVPV